MYGISPGENTAYTVYIGHTVALGTHGSFLYISFDFGLFIGRGYIQYQRMFRRERHERYTENSVGTCGEYLEFLVRTVNIEPYGSAFRTSYPVSLRFLYRFRPVYRFQSVEKPLRVCSYAHAPL